MSQFVAARPTKVSLYLIPVSFRVPLKFGAAGGSTQGQCARVSMTIEDESGRTATGWGESPLSVRWAWPNVSSTEAGAQAMRNFCSALTQAWADFDVSGHALEVGHAFAEQALPRELERFNANADEDPIPYLAALVCLSPFDMALHDAYGRLVDRPIYQTYNAEFLREDLSHYLEPLQGSDVSFAGRYPADYLVAEPPSTLPAWHLVGGLDPVDPEELRGDEPDDGYPVLLEDWIRADGLTCLKVKMVGNDQAWDYARLVKVGRIAIEQGCLWLTVDFNCTVTDPEYVNEILDRLRDVHPRIYAMILYVEQPFAYDLEANQIDVHSVSARKPLFMDESAHDWKYVRLGKRLGWTGVALKTCKTQTGALLSLCWAKAHGMTLMVQDLTNPMLAIMPHALLAAHAGTIMGVEVNAMQFYPEASKAEAKVHPGLYKRNHGCIDLSTLSGAGFGYRIDEIERDVGDPVTSAG